MATTSVPDHLADPTKWTEFVPSYGVLQAATRGASTASAAECKDAVAAQSTRSPIVLAFVLQGDEDHIHIGHSATAFPRCITDLPVLSMAPWSYSWVPTSRPPCLSRFRRRHSSALLPMWPTPTTTLSGPHVTLPPLKSSAPARTLLETLTRTASVFALCWCSHHSGPRPWSETTPLGGAPYHRSIRPISLLD